MAQIGCKQKKKKKKKKKNPARRRPELSRVFWNTKLGSAGVAVSPTLTVAGCQGRALRVAQEWPRRCCAFAFAFPLLLFFLFLPAVSALPVARPRCLGRGQAPQLAHAQFPRLNIDIDSQIDRERIVPSSLLIQQQLLNNNY
jgi:hypothetical protein